MKIEIRETAVFRRWLDRLKDKNAQQRVSIRIRRLAEGNPGDAKLVGGNVMELRIDFGPGYRVYYTKRGTTLILLLAGGDKKSQWRDIEVARTLAQRAMD